MAQKHEVLWTGVALRDLEDIRAYVRQDDPVAARRLASNIRQRVFLLQKYPFSGRMVPELSKKDIREVIVPPYRIVYRVLKRKIIVLRVWHGRRDLG